MRRQIEDLWSANQYLSATLNRWQSTPALTGFPQAREFQSVRVELLRAARCVQELSVHSEASPEPTPVIADYCKVLRQFAKLLPVLHVALETRRARLQAALNHLQRAGDWLAAHREVV